MNPIIKALAERAGLEFDDDLVLESEPIYFLTQTDLEKFAKFIVRGCVEIVETQRVPVRPSPSGEIAARWTMDALRECRDEIKEHFGVEP